MHDERFAISKQTDLVPNKINRGRVSQTIVSECAYNYYVNMIGGILRS